MISRNSVLLCGSPRVEMIKHLFVLTLMSASVLLEEQASDWMLLVAQQERLKPKDMNKSLQNFADTNIIIKNQMIPPMKPIKLVLCPKSPVAMGNIFIHQHENSAKITRRTFRNCFGSKRIQLSSDNQGMKFKENAFTDMTELEVLVLEQMNYKHVTQALTQNLKSLKNLTISACGVKLIDQNAFASLDNLEHLDLSHNNLSLVNRLFDNLGKLKSLDLFGNQLRTFPWDELRHLGELEWLALGKNNIVHYDVDKIAKYLPKLKVIYVDFHDEMPCSMVDELRNDFKTKAGHVRVHEGIGTGLVRRCPEQAGTLVPKSPQSNEIETA